MQARIGPSIGVLIAAALFGASTPASKLLLDGAIGPLRLAGLLYFGAAIAVAPFAWRDRAKRTQWRRKDVARVAGIVVLGGALGPVLLLIGLSGAPAASTALWLNLETVATAILGVTLFKEHVGARGWIAVAAITAGSVVLAAPGGFSFAWPALLVAAACLCWGFDNHLSSLVDGLTPAQTTLVKGTIAGATNFVLGSLFEEGRVTWSHAGLALGVGALAYGASIVLYVGGAQRLGATRAQMWFSTAPLWGAAIAFAVVGEPLTFAHAAAAIAMVLALALLYAERHDHEHRHEPLLHTHAHRHDDGHHDHAHDVEVPPETWHTHEHRHERLTHAHPHRPDLHHRHDH